MYSITDGTRFLGYGKWMKCPKCRNTKLQHVICSFSEQAVFLIKMPWACDTFTPTVICSICNFEYDLGVIQPHMEEIPGRDFWDEISEWDKLYGDKYREDRTNAIKTLLDQGKKATLESHVKSNYFQRRNRIKDLKKLGFHELASYLESAG